MVVVGEGVPQFPWYSVIWDGVSKQVIGTEYPNPVPTLSFTPSHLSLGLCPYYDDDDDDDDDYYFGMVYQGTVSFCCLFWYSVAGDCVPILFV